MLKKNVFSLDDPNASGRRSADHLQPEKGSFRNRRTRSASRERNLAKIRFCWRCHQTGHESFDCTAELQPANWCPRCLETSHWEDNCWVNEQEVRYIFGSCPKDEPLELFSPLSLTCTFAAPLDFREIPSFT